MERSRAVENLNIHGIDVTITLIERENGTWMTGVEVGRKRITSAPQGVVSRDTARNHAIFMAAQYIAGK